MKKKQVEKRDGFETVSGKMPPGKKPLGKLPLIPPKEKKEKKRKLIPEEITS